MLPYYYELRPLSVMSTSKSISERIIKYDYANSTCSEAVKRSCSFVWHGCRGLLCCGLCVLTLMALMYLSVELNDLYGDDVLTTSTVLSSGGNQTHLSMEDLLFEETNSYPICDSQYHGNLSAFDMASLSHMAYEIGDTAQDQIMSMQQLMCMYFDGMKPEDSLNNTQDCTWQIIHIRRDRPAFMNIRHNELQAGT